MHAEISQAQELRFHAATSISSCKLEPLFVSKDIDVAQFYFLSYKNEAWILGKTLIRTPFLCSWKLSKFHHIFTPWIPKTLTLKNKALQLWYTSHMVGTQITILTNWKSSPFRSLAHRGALRLPPTSEKVVVAMNWTHHCVWQRNTQVVNFTAWEEISSFGQNKLFIFFWSFQNLTGHKAEKFKDKGPGNMNKCFSANTWNRLWLQILSVCELDF